MKIDGKEVGNPIGLKVKRRQPFTDRVLLGDVRNYYYSAEEQRTRLKVTFFNGDPWPFDPLPSLVEII